MPFNGPWPGKRTVRSEVRRVKRIEKLRRHEEEIEVSEIGRSGINKGIVG